MNAREARVVDPILTDIAHGYTDEEFVGGALFPEVTVRQRGGRTLKFDKEAFRLYATRRAPGARTTRLEFGYGDELFALYQDAVEVPVPDELADEAKKTPGIDLQARSVRLGMAYMLRRHEVDCAAIAANPVSYDEAHQIDLAGDGQIKWSTRDCDPLDAVAGAQDAIADSTGHEPNVLLLGRQVYRVLKKNRVIRDAFKYTSNKSITVEMLQEYFDIAKVVVGRARYVADGPDGDFALIWGNVAIAAYVPPKPQGMEQPSYGYTYKLAGHPYVNKEYYDPNAKSWIHGVTYERAPVLTGMGAGYLIQNPA